MEFSVYLVLSQTGTKFSRCLRLVNHTPYNHISIGLDSSLETLYSFGRQCLFFPLAAGFVREHPGYGVYRQFSDTRCAVYRLPVSLRTYCRLKETIEQFEQQEWCYRYNFAGLLAMIAHIPLHRQRHFVCSQFVAYVLLHSGACRFPKDFSLVRPQDFMQLPDIELLYEGRLNGYHGADFFSARAFALAGRGFTAPPGLEYR